MATDYATSEDGLTGPGKALRSAAAGSGTHGRRVAAVRFARDGVAAYYDGRATSGQNYEERTGSPRAPSPARWRRRARPVAQSPPDGHGLRYLCVLDLGDARERIYYEMTHARGSHELLTELR